MTRSVRVGRAWVALCFAFALHIVDEAANDFLSFYDPVAESIRERFPWSPVPPVFTFEVWITALMVGVVALFALSPLAYRGPTFVRALAYPYAVIMILNGFGHTLWSAAAGALVPGVYSSVFLIVTGSFLLWALRTSHRSSRG